MDFITYGRDILPGRAVHISVCNKDEINTDYSSSFRLLVIKSGTIILELNNKKYFIEAPALFCLNNNDSLKLLKVNDIDLITVYFSPKIINSKFGNSFLTIEEQRELSITESQDHIWLNSFYYEDSETSRYIKLGPLSLKKVVNRCNSLEEELVGQPDCLWPCRSRAIFLEILFLLSNMQTKYVSFKSDILSESVKFENIILYIHNNYRDDITINSLVEKFSINRTGINDLFIKATGKSVIKYLIDLRVKLACLVLRDTMRPIKEIAFQSGFNDITHFGRTFKKVTQLSPSQYRERFNWMLI